MQKKKPLRVGIVFDDTLDSNDGVAQYVKGVGKWLSEQGHEVSYLVGQTNMTSWAGGKVYSLSKNIKVSFNGNRVSMPLPSSSKNIKDLLAREKLDVIHIQMPYSPFMAQKVVSRAYGHSALIGTFHIFPASTFAKLGAKLLHLFQALNLKKIGRVFSVSSAAAEFAKQTFKLDTEISSNVVDLERYKKAPEAIKKNHIVFLGRLVSRKGCSQLIEAFSLLHGKHPDTYLTIAGDGPERPGLQKLVNKLDLADSIEFTGFISEQDKPSLLGSAQIACFPALYGESFGIVLIEAMAAGAGVVLGGDNPGYRTVLGEREELLVNPNDTRLFADRLEELLVNTNKAKQLHDWQQEHVKKYSVDKVGQRILDGYYEEIAKSNKSIDN